MTCDHGHAPDHCPTTGCVHSRRQSRCIKCGGIPSGALDARGIYCIECAPPASTVGRPRVGESPRAGAGIVSGNVRGVDGDGRVPEGAASWEWRPPQRALDRHHDDPIEMAGPLGPVVLYQQSPPIHVKGTPPRRAGATGGAALAHVTALGDIDHLIGLAELSTTEARIYRLRHLEGVARKEIAERVGVTMRTVRRALVVAMRKVRGVR